VDLDRFKLVNDTYGHAAGDQLLRQVAARMTACLRSGDSVGRLSGDEFSVMLSNLAKADDAGMVAQKIVDALAAPFDIDNNQAYVTASVGIALYPGDGVDADTLIKNADTAMYRAKEQGRNGYQFFLPQMNERLVKRQQLEGKLRGALDRAEFLLHYQPKVNVASGELVGLEALLRWKQPGLALMHPDSFIPLLEETGLIVPVGEWVLRTACQQNKAWQDAGLPPVCVAVNLSPLQLDESLVRTVESALQRSGLDARWLELEITETAILQRCAEAAAVLSSLQAIGVRISMDDFGTGYSSLRYLKRLPIDTLKIDRSFIQDLPNDADGAAITRAVIALAHSLRIRVVAEGVETASQAAFLRERGCDEAQGFAFGAPQPAEQMIERLGAILLPQRMLAGT
jgi:diguanylate cyclase (GGDEF)-like protein